MAKSLVIVESPAKAKTIGKYLGNQYIVKASLGHIKDLPKKDLAVAVEADFRPDYQVIEGKKKLITELKQAAKGVESIYLAADPDREGEAICAHLQEELEGKGKNAPQIYRVMFNEITKNAIQKAFEKPLTVNVQLVGRATGEACSRSPGRLQDLAAAVGQGPPRTFCGTRPNCRVASDRGAGARNPRIPKARILDHRCQSRCEKAAGPESALCQAQRRNA